MRDMRNVVGDVDDLRRERDARNNPPDFEPGQGGDDDWSMFDDDASDPFSSTDDSDFLGSSFNPSMGSMDFGSNAFSNSIQGGGNTKDPYSIPEDKYFDAAKDIFKYIFKYLKEYIKAVRYVLEGANPIFYVKYGRAIINYGIAFSCIGLVIGILGLFSNGFFKNGIYVLIGGLLSLATGVMFLCLNIDKARAYKEDLEDDMVDFTESEDFEEEESNEVLEDIDEDDPWDSFEEESVDEFGEDEDSDLWNSLADSVEEDIVVEENIYDEDINIDSAIDSIRVIEPHTQTRQYLYEEYSRVLPLISPSFSELAIISENSDNFIVMDKILADAAVQVGTKEDKIPYLQELRENQFIIQLKCTRPTGLKEEDIANEIANIYSRDDYGAVIHEGVYATTSSVGSNYIINIFKGENCVISLADTYREVKEFVLDPKVKCPIVVGVNELGKVWYFDADKVHSYIISGKPRSGKSWTVVSFILQLCMYNSPKEVIFEAFDVKANTSDYNVMSKELPHFRKFETDKDRILQRLRYLTTTEADRRKSLLKKYNEIDIADLKKKGEDVDIPYLYVIIDEIVGLIGKMNKEEHAEFKELVNVLITQMPNLGIRLVLVPHRVTNDIVPKTTYTNVGFIACVRSETKEMQSTLDIGKRDFPYDLSNTGDMALKTGVINKGKTVFCHGIGITSSNDKNKDIYKFVGSLWGKLEPDLVKKDSINLDNNSNIDITIDEKLSGVESVIDESFSDEESDAEYYDLFKDIMD